MRPFIKKKGLKKYLTAKKYIYCNKLSKIIFDKKEFIADVLMELNSATTKKYIKKSVEEIIDYVNYLGRLILLEKDEHFWMRIFIDRVIDVQPVHVIQKAIFLTTFQVKSDYVADNRTFLHLVMFSQLLEEAGFPNVFNYVSICHQQDLKIITDNLETDTKLTVMIIFDDSDLHCAIDCITDAIWNASEKFPVALGNILVQESIYQEFKHFFEERLMQYKDKKIKYVSENYSVTNPSRGSFENYEASEVIQIQDTTIMFHKQIEKFYSNIIAVDVFRTESEVVTMCNSNIGNSYASIWIDSGPLARNIANALEMKQIWINGFALNHPVQYSCFNSISNIGSVNGSTQLSGILKEVSNTVETAKKQSEKLMTQNKWGDIIKETAINSLGNVKYENSSYLLSRLLAYSEENCIRSLSTRDFNIEVNFQPLRVITLAVFDDVSIYDCIYTISTAIAFGNCVVVILCNTDLHTPLMEWLKNCGLPQYIVNVINFEKEVDLHSEVKDMCQWNICGTSLNIKTHAKEKNLKNYSLENFSKIPLKTLQVISSVKKCIWYPKK
uniref:Aldehyde dehydrogenase domain-containing protein n=3 Tax=Clastoptera arizonana TaxID=38151 RepID=A0A1B6EEF3_9HEMI